ncbi:MAG TPA: Gfo/Idh/MocA family oxidoreductase [Candidatus Dormibacteraeota bacterium]
MRIVQVGLGNWGRYWLRRILPQVPEAQIVGCVDVDPEALALAREQVGVPADCCFASLDAALGSTEPDAVLVTTTLAHHVPVARAALESGLHVLVEKPFAPSLAEARALVELADARGRVLMVSQNYRFFPAARGAASLVAHGGMGALHEVEIDFRHRSVVTETDGRRGHRALEQPLLMDMSIHHFDLLRLVLGAEPERVDCHAWNPPWSGFDGPPSAVATILFPGVVVSYRGSWLSWGQDTPWAGEWRMTFEQGEVSWTSRHLLGSTAAERVLVRPGAGEPHELTLPVVPLLDQAGSLAEFVDAVRTGREPESSGRSNMGSLALALGAVESSEHGVPVTLPSGVT